MAQRGGESHIHYKEKRGLKVTGGQFVKKSTLLTREGNKWKAGKNVGGKGSLFALCDGIVYFSRKKGSYKKNKITTFINIKPETKRKT
jgi:ribosomal protein L27